MEAFDWLALCHRVLKYFKALQLDIIAHTPSLKFVIISYNVALSCFMSYIARVVFRHADEQTCRYYNHDNYSLHITYAT